MENNTEKIISAGDCKTLEDYRNYERQRAKEWYEKNRERKLAYQKEYYRRKKLEAAKSKN